jgi:hypothetical protein
MAKKRLSSVELSWVVVEHLRESGSVPYGISLAVVPDPRFGWRVAVAIRSRRFVNAEGERAIAAVERRLRSEYVLT